MSKFKLFNALKFLAMSFLPITVMKATKIWTYPLAMI